MCRGGSRLRQGLATIAHAGLELEDFQPQPPEQLGSQACATRFSSVDVFFFKRHYLKMILYDTVMVDACLHTQNVQY